MRVVSFVTALGKNTCPLSQSSFKFWSILVQRLFQKSKGVLVRGCAPTSHASFIELHQLCWVDLYELREFLSATLICIDMISVLQGDYCTFYTAAHCGVELLEKKQKVACSADHKWRMVI